MLKCTRKNIFPVGIASLIAIIMLYRQYLLPLFRYKTPQIEEDHPSQCREDHPPRNGFAKTTKGYTSFEELEINVFLPNNFKILDQSHLVPKLDFVKRYSCAKVFDDWLSIAMTNNESKTPPDTLPPEQMNDFLLNGYSNLTKAYMDNRPIKEPREWRQIPLWLKLNESELRTITGYGKEGRAIYNALKKYPVTGKSGFVVGSRTPWIEVNALQLGASKVLTVEYQEIAIHGIDKVKYVHPIDFAKQWKKHQNGFDFAISFSSLEHSGLGRFGDPIDPIGDLRELWKILCLLKPGGIFYLGLPFGTDTVIFNLHRHYGAIRLAMITAGYEWLATFYGDTPDPYNLTYCDLEYSDGKQYVYVLKKL